MEKQHFSVARVATHTKENISKYERHDERKNTTYSNTNIVAERTPMNIYFKRYDSTFNQKFDEMVKSGQISTRGLKANVKIYNELVFDVNSLYFEQNGGYEFAKRFYEKAYNFAEKEMGTENILSAVLHADELNTALTEEFEKSKNRIIEIDNLFQHIYEDNISGKLTDERFRRLSFNYNKEQQELKLKIEQLSNEIENKEKKENDLTQFISNVKKYTEITELTPEILNELIEKIMVHQSKKVNGRYEQTIDIHYRDVGIISFPISLDDIEITIKKILNKKSLILK